MKKLTAILFALAFSFSLASGAIQRVLPSTDYTRGLLRSTNAADARGRLGITAGSTSNNWVGSFTGNGAGLTNVPGLVSSLTNNTSSAGVVTGLGIGTNLAGAGLLNQFTTNVVGVPVLGPVSFAGPVTITNDSLILGDVSAAVIDRFSLIVTGAQLSANSATATLSTNGDFWVPGQYKGGAFQGSDVNVAGGGTFGGGMTFQNISGSESNSVLYLDADNKLTGLSSIGDGAFLGFSGGIPALSFDGGALTNLNVTTTTAYITNLFAGDTYTTNLYVTNVYAGDIITTNLYVTNLLTAKTIIVTNISVISNTTNQALNASQYVKTDSAKVFASTMDGSGWTNLAGTGFSLGTTQTDGATNFTVTIGTIYQKIVATNDVAFTNVSGIGSASVKVLPNGADRWVYFPTNWGWLSTNNFVLSGSQWKTGITNGASRIGWLSLVADGTSATNVAALWKATP